eukprot:1002928-Prorocentrum_lima.AAC.1
MAAYVASPALVRVIGSSQHLQSTWQHRDSGCTRLFAKANCPHWHSIGKDRSSTHLKLISGDGMHLE